MSSKSIEKCSKNENVDEPIEVNVPDSQPISNSSSQPCSTTSDASKPSSDTNFTGPTPDKTGHLRKIKYRKLTKLKQAVETFKKQIYENFADNIFLEKEEIDYQIIKSLENEERSEEIFLKAGY